MAAEVLSCEWLDGFYRNEEAVRGKKPHKDRLPGMME
jgi:hypothetical protein